MAPRSCSRSNEFKPTDDELLRSFLYNKVHGKPLPNNGTILECDLFGDTNPWEIWEEFGDSHSYDGKDLYFFTKLKKKNGPKARSVRTIGLGAWEGEDTGKTIAATNDNNTVLGMKKRFRFEKSGTDQDGKWIMHEYSLHPSLITDSSAINNVLCRFRKNLGQNARKRSESKQETMIDVKKRKTLILGRSATKQVEKKKTLVVGLAATTEPDINNNVNKVVLEKDSCQEPKSHPESGEKTQVVETSAGTESKNEEEGGDLTMSWPELFALQLRSECTVPEPEEEIHMLPNTFYNISENFDISNK